MKMRKLTRRIPALAALMAAMAFAAPQAYASMVPFAIDGLGFSGSGFLTIAPNVAPADPNPNCGTAGNNACRTDPAGAYAITAISGTFSDPTDHIVNAAITGLVPTHPANERDPDFDPKVPSSLSFVDFASGPAGALSYDNLYYLGGSPIVCTDFTNTGTFVDVYGVAFTVAGGYTVDLWGDGDLFGPGTQTYGLSVTDGTRLIRSEFAGVNAVAAVPEPSSVAMLGIGLLGMLAWRKRSAL